MGIGPYVVVVVVFFVVFFFVCFFFFVFFFFFFFFWGGGGGVLKNCLILHGDPAAPPLVGTLYEPSIIFLVLGTMSKV